LPATHRRWPRWQRPRPPASGCRNCRRPPWQRPRRARCRRRTEQAATVTHRWAARSRAVAALGRLLGMLGLPGASPGSTWCQLSCAPWRRSPDRRVLICQVRRGPRGDAGCAGHVCIACAEVEPGPGQRGRPTEAARPAGGFSSPSNIHTVLCHSSPGLGSTSLLLQGGRPPWLSTLSSFEVVY
jgi:hypothetical protein